MTSGADIRNTDARPQFASFRLTVPGGASEPWAPADRMRTAAAHPRYGGSEPTPNPGQPVAALTGPLDAGSPPPRRSLGARALAGASFAVAALVAGTLLFVYDGSLRNTERQAATASLPAPHSEAEAAPVAPQPAAPTAALEAEQPAAASPSAAGLAPVREAQPPADPLPPNSAAADGPRLEEVSDASMAHSAQPSAAAEDATEETPISLMLEPAVTSTLTTAPDDGREGVAAEKAQVPTAPPRNADCDRCPELVVVPEGSYVMGSLREASEHPVHKVTVERFAIGKYPVTIGEWKLCVFAGDCPDVKAAGSDETPMHNVSWEDARAYVEWLSRLTGGKYRLPSEAEWEYAARGGTTTNFWWGDTPMRNIANCKNCSDDYDAHRPVEAGAFKANPFGLYDMSGGVAEWVEDCWHSTYKKAPSDGSAWLAENCRQRVLRGGSWKSGWDYLRSASRDYYDQNVRYITHGFRVAMTPQ